MIVGRVIVDSKGDWHKQGVTRCLKYLQYKPAESTCRKSMPGIDHNELMILSFERRAVGLNLVSNLVLLQFLNTTKFVAHYACECGVIFTCGNRTVLSKMCLLLL